MFERGIYPPPSQFEAWFISSSHTAQNINRTIYAAQEVMCDLKN
jgi:glutamate-1-semialdehyde 2,1-aminomutase